MKKIVLEQYNLEKEYFIECRNSGNTRKAWTHLERAHILGQFDWWYHFEIHFMMFSFAFYSFNLKEFIFQIPRIMLAIPGSIFKKAPHGNVGTSRVGIFQVMPLPDDISKIIKENL